MQIKTDTHGYIIKGLRAAAAKTKMCNRHWKFYAIYWSVVTHEVHIVTDEDPIDSTSWVLVLSSQRDPMTQQQIADLVYTRICDEMKKFS